MGKKASPVVIGAFVVGALALAVLGVAVFGSGRLFRTTYLWVAFFPDSVNGLRVGAPVKFKGVQIGSVKDVLINIAGRTRLVEDISIPVILEIDADRVQRKGANLPMDPAVLQAMVGQGLRAQLNTESFVTGVLYVELDFFPGTPARLVKDPEVPYPEVPTLPTTLEQVQMKASEIINKLSSLDLQPLLTSLQQTIDGINGLVNAPSVRTAVDGIDQTMALLNKAIADFNTLTRNLNASTSPLTDNLKVAAERAAAALEGIDRVVTPGSPITYQLGRTLQDVSDAARAIRELADYLERNPSALLRGKPGAEETQ